MEEYDLMIIGPATRDVNIDYTGAEDRSVGWWRQTPRASSGTTRGGSCASTTGRISAGICPSSTY